MKGRFAAWSKTMVRSLLLSAAIVSALVWWGWQKNIHGIAILHSTVSDNALDDDTEAILDRLSLIPRARASGLIRSLNEPLSVKHIAWKGTTKHKEQGNYDVYIFDAFIRPIAPNPIPPVCVVFDGHHNLLTWATVAPFSAGFLSANLDEHDVLTITTVANFFYGKGIYRYAIQADAITPLDDGEFVKFGNEERPKDLPKLIPSKISL